MTAAAYKPNPLNPIAQAIRALYGTTFPRSGAASTYARMGMLRTLRPAVTQANDGTVSVAPGTHLQGGQGQGTAVADHSGTVVIPG